MASVTIDKTLEFVFPTQWKYCLYDKSDVYNGLQNKINSLCAVDLLLYDPDSLRLYLIEVKDYATTSEQTAIHETITGPLVDKLARKFLHTFSGLTCAKLRGDVDLKQYYRALINPKVKKHLVSFVELGALRDKRHRLSPSYFTNLTMKLGNVLHPVPCKKHFFDIKCLPAWVGWSVVRK